jgi:hypothetical protein
VYLSCYLLLRVLRTPAVFIADVPAQYLILLRVVPAVAPMAACGKQALHDTYESDKILHRNEIIKAFILTATPHY